MIVRQIHLTQRGNFKAPLGKRVLSYIYSPMKKILLGMFFSDVPVDMGQKAFILIKCDNFLLTDKYCGCQDLTQCSVLIIGP